MLAGVTIVDPSATVIDYGVEIGQDTVIAPFTSLLGATEIGAGATIGPGSTLIDAVVGDGSTLIQSYVTGAEVGERVSVGPFAYLRPGTVLRDGSKAGTFVEIKNSDVGAGTKVPHLSYIGDADIGEQTNLGAATITANYDGYRKNRTQDRQPCQDERRHDPGGAGDRRRRRVHGGRFGDRFRRPRRGAGRLARASRAPPSEPSRATRPRAPSARRPRVRRRPSPSDGVPATVSADPQRDLRRCRRRARARRRAAGSRARADPRVGHPGPNRRLDRLQARRQRPASGRAKDSRPGSIRPLQPARRSAR